jgi:periplasmic protein CpxP/Spy
MRRLFSVIVLAALSGTGLVMPALAQEQAAAVPSGGTQPPSPDQIVDMLGPKLGLSEAQKGRIRPIIADRQQKIAALRADTSLRRGKKLREMKGVLDDSDQKIKAVLDDRQWAQYTQIEQQLREEFRQRMRDGS